MAQTRTNTPERLRWAVDIVAADSPTTVLEIGCERGMAIELLCDRLGGNAEIVGLDRSETAIRATAGRNAHYISAGRVRLVHAEIATASFDETKFDSIFAVNVNVFWVHPAKDELAAVRHALAPTGRMALIYEPPSAQLAARIETLCTRNLEENGFTAVNVMRRDLDRNVGVCILARASSSGNERATVCRPDRSTMRGAERRGQVSAPVRSLREVEQRLLRSTDLLRACRKP